VTPELGSALTGDRVEVQVAGKLAPGVHHGQLIVSACAQSRFKIDVVVTVREKAPDAEP